MRLAGGEREWPELRVASFVAGIGSIFFGFYFLREGNSGLALSFNAFTATFCNALGRGSSCIRLGNQLVPSILLLIGIILFANGLRSKYVTPTVRAPAPQVRDAHRTLAGNRAQPVEGTAPAATIQSPVIGTFSRSLTAPEIARLGESAKGGAAGAAGFAVFVCILGIITAVSAIDGLGVIALILGFCAIGVSGGVRSQSRLLQRALAESKAYISLGVPIPEADERSFTVGGTRFYIPWAAVGLSSEPKDSHLYRLSSRGTIALSFVIDPQPKASGLAQDRRTRVIITGCNERSILDYVRIEQLSV